MTAELFLGCLTILTLAAVIIVALTTSNRDANPYRRNHLEDQRRAQGARGSDR
jgi:hypothetical protein